jgi:hypothetical protein
MLVFLLMSSVFHTQDIDSSRLIHLMLFIVDFRDEKPIDDYIIREINASVRMMR